VSDYVSVDQRLSNLEEENDHLKNKLAKLTNYLMDQPWHEGCEIILDYMPPYPRPETKPIVVVRYNDGTKYPPYLRYSRGPKQGWMWDIYGDDLQNWELAVIAISQAPAPVNVGPLEFRFKFDHITEDK